MDGLEMLKADHKLVAQLFEKADKTENESEKQKLCAQISQELETHTHLEETIFYPALEEKEALKDITMEAYEEHKQVKTLIREIAKLADGSERFDAKLSVMKENVEHHVEEEETEMFPKVRKLFSQDEINQWGEQFAAAKQEYGKQYKTKTSSK